METQTEQRTHILKRIRLGYNPRGEHDAEHVKALTPSVKELGILEPLLVIAVNDDPNYDFETKGGEHRYRAARAAHGDDYHCPIRELALTPTELMAVSFVSNLHLKMSVGAEAKGAQMVLTECRNDKVEAARVLGWSMDKLEARLCLNACTDAVLDALKHKRIKLGHAELLAGLKPASQNKILDAVLASGTTVSVLKGQIARNARILTDAIFDTAQCLGCEHNSARQAGLFSESIGNGYCQHPKHYDELTEAVVQAKAESLRDTYQVIKIYRTEDGFLRIPVAIDGEHAVGEEQYGACQQCASFGCGISNIPGSYGEVTGSLCFDAVCNDTKRFEYRKRTTGPYTSADSGAECDGDASAGPVAAPVTPVDRIGIKKSADAKVMTGSEIGKQVLAYRVECWRKWLSQALINASSADQSARALFALVLAGKAGQIDTERFATVAAEISGAECKGNSAIHTALTWAGGLDVARFGQLQQAMIGAAAFGMEESTLVSMLDFLGVDEERFYTLDDSLLTLLTKTQLTGLAKELGLNKKLPAFIALSEGKKIDFIKALLSIKNQDYTGLVPAVIKYPRPLARKVKAERKRAGAAVTTSASKADRKEPSGTVTALQAGEGTSEVVAMGGMGTTGEASAPVSKETCGADLQTTDATPIHPGATYDGVAALQTAADEPAVVQDVRAAEGHDAPVEAVDAAHGAAAIPLSPNPGRGRKAGRNRRTMALCT